MSQEKFWQMAVAINDVCPVCKEKVLEYRRCTATIINTARTDYKFYSFDALYCRHCDLPLANDDIRRNVHAKTGWSLCTFNTGIGYSLEMVQNQQKRRITLNPAMKIDATGFSLVSNKISNKTVVWKTPQTLRSRLDIDDLQDCPKCHVALRSDYTLVPISQYEKAKVPGKSCNKCGTLYVRKSKNLTRLLLNNPLSKGFTLDGRELWNDSIIRKEKEQKELEKAQRLKEVRQEKRAEKLKEERRKRLSSISDAVVMVIINFNNQEQEYIITNHEALSIARNIFCYKSVKGRELLSAAFEEDRAKNGILFENKFQVVGTVFPDKDSQELPYYILPMQLCIKADGGYLSSVKNRNYEIVDLLVYSPYTKRYEVMHATYDKENLYCYTDIAIFRNFVNEYGNPRTYLEFLPGKNSCSNGKNLKDLRSESVLMGYGYNVSETNHLSDRERRKILEEIVDLEILTVHQVVSLLDFHCRLHSGEKFYFARLKWQSDKKYIENYKVNPNRFLIAQ